MFISVGCESVKKKRGVTFGVTFGVTRKNEM
nr:MAG TPA: hypothetical protein [Caudoviricetes sp.]